MNNRFADSQLVRFARIALRNLVKNRNRSIILGGAIATVTVILVVLMAVIGGMKDTMLENATALASGHVNIAGFYKVSQTSAAPMVTKYPPLREIAANSVPEASLILERIKAYGKVISDTNTLQVPMWGVNMEREKEVLGRLELAPKASYFVDKKIAKGEPEYEGNIQHLAQRGTIVLFASQAKKLNARVGDSLTVSMPTYRNMANTLDVKLVAVLKDIGLMSTFSCFLNELDVRKVYQLNDDATGQIMIYLQNELDTKLVEERLREILSEKKYTLMEKEAAPFWMKFDRVAGETWIGQRLDITTWEDEMGFIKWVLDLTGALTFLLVLVLLTIITLGLVNTLGISIRERTSEVGTLRAIGLRKSGVVWMFLIESAVLSALAAITGIVVGVLLGSFTNLLQVPVSEAMQMFLLSDTLKLSFRTGDLVFTFLMITGFLTMGSLLPAFKAGKMKPITAINHVQ